MEKWKEKCQNKQIIKKYHPELAAREIGDNWVTMKNSLVRAGHGLSLIEKRTIAIAIAKINSPKFQSKNDPLTVKIHASEYAELFDCDLDVAYQALNEGTQHLQTRVITFFEPAYNRQGKPIKDTKVKQPWIIEGKYQNQEAWISICFNPKLYPVLTSIKAQFTSYQLKEVASLRSSYSWRLFELLTQHKDTGRYRCDIEDFCASLDVPKSLQPFGQLRRRVIEPAVKELCEKDGWLIDWRGIKVSRRVEELEFRFHKNPQVDLFENQPTPRKKRTPKKES